MKRSRVYSLTGTTLLLTSGVYLMVYAIDPFDLGLGDGAKSTLGTVLCVAGVAAAAALIAASVVIGREEKREKARKREGLR